MLAYECNPSFVPGAKGELFVLDISPAGAMKSQALYLPPHGEELNRCRSVISAHARALASQGVACRVLDYFGSGDSEGDFSEGNWTVWQQDILSQVECLKQSNMPVMLIGFRLGALCALDFTSMHPELIQRLVLIQPVVNGKQYVTQLLRQRMAAQMNSEQQTETTDQMRQLLAGGADLEIGGYQFGSQLLVELDKQQMADKTNISSLDIDWLEFVSEEGKGVTLASNKIISQLETQSNRVVVRTFNDPPIWQLHEREAALASVKTISELEW